MVFDLVLQEIQDLELKGAQVKRIEKKFRELTNYVREISREYDYFFKNFADALLKKQLEIEELKKKNIKTPHTSKSKEDGGKDE